MNLDDPFEHLQHKLGRKKGWESKCQFDFRPLKVRNRLKLRVCRWCVIYRWKAFDKGYNFSNFILIKGLHKKLWASKVARILTLGILGLLIWEFREKWHLSATLVASHREYYKGEGDNFPQVRAVVNFVSLCMPVICPCTKSVPTMH
jgi:hypothetical protein